MDVRKRLRERPLMAGEVLGVILALADTAPEDWGGETISPR